MSKKIKTFLVISTIISALFCFNMEIKANTIQNITQVAANNCDTLLGDPTVPNHPAYWIQKGLDLIKYAAIVCLLLLSIAEFLKAIVSNDKDAIKKAGTKSLKRFIYCTIIFFLPILINFILELFELTGTCGYH